MRLVSASMSQELSGLETTSLWLVYLVTLLNNPPSYFLEITDSYTVGLDFHYRGKGANFTQYNP